MGILVYRQPTLSGDGARIEVLDQMRGVALLSIFLCNLVALSGASATDGTPGGWMYLLVHIVLGDSSRTLFSFMFGMSMLLIYDSARRRDRQPYWTLLRRMLTLLLIGSVHLYMIWSGDILFMYALDGLMLLAFLWMSPLLLLSTGIVLLLLTSSTLQDWTPGLQAWLSERNWPSYDPSSWPFWLLSQLSGSMPSLQQWYEHPNWFLMMSEWQLAIQHLHFFLFGMYAYRKGIFQQIARFPGRFAIAGVILLLVGLAGKIANSFGYTAPWVSTIAQFYPFAYVAVTIGAIFCIVWIGYRGGWASRVLSLFGPIGRMAFSCYLLQSLIYVSVFTATGEEVFSYIGWVDVMPYGRIFAGSLLFFIAQMIFATYWLKYFKYGPFEWLWRIGTNLEIPSFRRNDRSSVSSAAQIQQQ